MKKLTDDELDGLLKTALQTNGPVGIPPGFSARVVAGIGTRKHRSADRIFSFVWLLVVAGLAAIFVCLTATNFKSFSAPFAAILRYKWIMLFGMTCIWLFQYLDRRLVRNRFMAA